MKIYLDVCCFNRPFDDQSQLRVRLESEAKLAVQERIRSGHIQLGWSYMMDFENEANPYEERRLSIASWRGMATSDVSQSPGILTLAKELNERGFKSKDALHLACAIESGCEAFLTSDDGVLKKQDLTSGIEILNPIDYSIRGNDY